MQQDLNGPVKLFVAFFMASLFYGITVLWHHCLWHHCVWHPLRQTSILALLLIRLEP